MTNRFMSADDILRKAGFAVSTIDGSLGSSIIIAVKNRDPEFLKRLQTDPEDRDSRLNDVNDAVNDAVSSIYRKLNDAADIVDPKTLKSKSEERASFNKVFTEVFGSYHFVEVPNDYYKSELWNFRSPWMRVYTSWGVFLIGWRKRVIELSWEDTIFTGTAEELFKDQNTTKSNKMIHAWSYDELQAYLIRLKDSHVSTTQD